MTAAVDTRGLRDERLLRSAFIVSSTGDWVFRFALPILVLQLTGSAITTAFTYAVEFVPYVVIGLFSGVVADRADRRRLMVVCDVVSAAIVAGIAVICLFDRPPAALVIAAAFLLSCVRPFSFPAFQAFLADRVAPERRASMNAWVQGADSTLSMLGPIAGVAVVTLLGPAVASAVNAVSFAASAILVGCTAVVAGGEKLRSSVRAAIRSVRPDFVAGLRALTANGPVLWGTILLTATNFAQPAVASNLVYIVAGPSASMSLALALVVAAQGAGAVLGAAFAPRLLRRWSTGSLLQAAMCGLAVALLAPAVSQHPVVLAGSWFLAGVATSSFVVPWRTYRQNTVDPAFMGRVVGVQRAVAFAATPVGALVGGWVLTELGAGALFLVAGAVQTLVWLGTRYSPLGRAGQGT